MEQTRQQISQEDLKKLDLQVVSYFRCGLCGANLGGDLEFALKHPKPLIGLDLPIGLVYQGTNHDAKRDWINVIVERKVEGSHKLSYTDNVIAWDNVAVTDIGRSTGNIWDFDEFSSRFSNKGLHGISYSLFSEKSFDEFVRDYAGVLEKLREKYGVEKFLRTCPDVEAIVRRS